MSLRSILPICLQYLVTQTPRRDRWRVVGGTIQCVLTVLMVICQGHTAETVEITTISGVKSTGELQSWLADKIEISSAAQTEIAVTDVRVLTFGHPAIKAAEGASTIWFSNGDRVLVRGVSAVDDLLTASSPVLGANSAKIALDKVAAMILEMPHTMDQRQRLFADLQTLPPGNDLVLLTNGDRSLGEFKGLDPAFVELKGATTTLKFDRSRVRAIRFDPDLTNTKRTLGRRAVLTLTDGSRLTATEIESAGDSLKLKTFGMGSISIPLSFVAACHLFGERIIPIADYEPEKVDFTPYLSSTWPLIRNANVLHGPLSLRGTEFITGLGMHSRMAVTYKLHGNEQEFQAIVGIDDSAHGAGSAIFAVELDGRRVWTSPELTGKSATTELPGVSLRGAKQLTLIVDFGEFADVSDYANWCDAVLIVNRSR